MMSGNGGSRDDCTVYVGNLDVSVPLADMEELIYELFLQAGPVEKVFLPVHTESGGHKTYGFVVYEHKESAGYSMQLLTGILLHGRPLKVRMTSKREPVFSTTHSDSSALADGCDVVSAASASDPMNSVSTANGCDVSNVGNVSDSADVVRGFNNPGAAVSANSNSVFSAAANHSDLEMAAPDFTSDNPDITNNSDFASDFASGNSDFASGNPDFTSDFASGNSDFASGNPDFASGNPDFASGNSDFASGNSDFASGNSDSVFISTASSNSVTDRGGGKGASCEEQLKHLFGQRLSPALPFPPIPPSSFPPLNYLHPPPPILPPFPPTPPPFPPPFLFPPPMESPGTPGNHLFPPPQLPAHDRHVSSSPLLPRQPFHSPVSTNGMLPPRLPGHSHQLLHRERVVHINDKPSWVTKETKEQIREYHVNQLETPQYHQHYRHIQYS